MFLQHPRLCHSCSKNVKLFQYRIIQSCIRTKTSYPFKKKQQYPLPSNLEIRSKKDAINIVRSWSKHEQDLIIESLHKNRKIHDIPWEQTGGEEGPPTRAQLRRVGIQAALPFIVFGFLDNFIMIVSGNYIESLIIRMALGIGTMTAAALGNILADMFSVGIADRVENVLIQMGFPILDITASQAKLKVTKYAVLWGRCLGIMIGCTLGMFPLLFSKPSSKDKELLNQD